MLDFGVRNHSVVWCFEFIAGRRSVACAALCVTASALCVCFWSLSLSVCVRWFGKIEDTTYGCVMIFTCGYGFIRINHSKFQVIQFLSLTQLLWLRRSSAQLCETESC